MDAASCFILGSEFVPITCAELSVMDSARLLDSGKSHKQQLPKKLYIPDNLAADLLSSEAERCSISVIRIPEDQLLIFIDEAREGFKDQFGSGSYQ